MEQGKISVCHGSPGHIKDSDLENQNLDEFDTIGSRPFEVVAC